MRLSELRGALTQLEYIAVKRGNVDPIVELFHLVDGENFSLTLNLEAINNDPEGQLIVDGSIHLPLMEIVTRGYVVKYYKLFDNVSTVAISSTPIKNILSIVIQAESGEHAESLFKKYFSTYTIESITVES